jgi:predicted GH43/DUF377 family glycosyl hydrolase
MTCVPLTGPTHGRRPGYAQCCAFMGALLTLLASAQSVAQTAWANDNSPVLNPGPGWESSWVNFVSVIYQDSQYVMWYSGGDNTNGINLSVGRATSRDALHWTKDTLNPVMQHGASAWDGMAGWVPKVLKIGNAYTMWYTGASFSDVWQIGRATSSDGRVWVRDTTNPVIRVGAPGQWDAALVHTGSVVFDGTTYRMWYTGMSQGYGAGSSGIGLATSADGIHWVKDTLDNPVLAAGPPGAWDQDGVGECSVVYDSTSYLYLMFYDGNEVDFFQETSGIGYASSADGIHWVKYAGNPVLPNRLPGSWTTAAYAPFVLLRDSTFYMWYSGSDAVGFASSVRSLRSISVSRTSEDFQNVRPGTVSDTLQVSLSNWGFTPLVISSVLQSHSEFAVSGLSPLPVTVPPFDEVSVGIVFRPTAADVVVLDTVVIASNDTLHPTVKISLRGRGSGPVRATVAGGIYGFAATSGGSSLYAIDKGTGAVTLIANLSPHPPTHIEAFTIRPSDRIMYAAQSTGNRTDIYRISSSFGDIDQAGSIPLGGLTAMAFSEGDTLYVADSLGRLYRTEGIGDDTVLVGETGHVFTGLAFRPGTGTLWGTVGDSLFSVDRSTAATTLRGVSQGGVVHSTIAFGPLGTLYGLYDNDIVIINVNDGSVSPIGQIVLPGKTLSLAMNTELTGEVVPVSESLPKTYRLYQNYPNPFNPTTTIRYDIPVSGHVVLSVHDILGRLVKTLVDRDVSPGTHTEIVDGTKLASGIYYYRIRSGNFVDTRKFILLH